MLLDIIIPQYKENDITIKNLLDSINKQTNVDFNDINITIVNDKSDVLISNNLLNSYDKLHINYIINKENVGPGMTRQNGIDNTSGNFIMFIDSDDELIDNQYILYILTSCLKDKNPDLIVTNFIREINNNGSTSYYRRHLEDSISWLHGKIYKRKYLIDNDIRFHEKLRCQEDQYFNTCVFSNINIDNVIYLDIDTYMWKDNYDSITRKNRKYDFLVDIFDDFYNCAIYSIEYQKLHNVKTLNRYIIKSSFAIYQILNSECFKYDELKEKNLYYYNKLEKFIDNNIDVYKKYNKDELEKYYNEEYKSLNDKGNYIKQYKGFNDFYNTYIK